MRDGPKEGDCVTTLDLPARIKRTMQELTGQKAPLDNSVPASVERLLGDDGSGIGPSQLNELLLWLGYDRVTRGFFQYLVDGRVTYDPTETATIPTYARLVEGVERFRRTALLLCGNVKYAFKTLSSDEDVLVQAIERIAPKELKTFSQRHDEILPIQQIKPEDTYYLGYLIRDDIQARLLAGDANAVVEEQHRLRILDTGLKNHNAYLASDHLDVYVATSMRTKSDYAGVSRLVSTIFSQPSLRELKLRYFDPTQAWCKNREDKGLVEALMLRRAKCTIYLAQENDTFGKDSELASTLAQGKTVIAYVPNGDSAYVRNLLDDQKLENPEKSTPDIILEQLKMFDPRLAWSDKTLQAWIADSTSMDEAAGVRMLSDLVVKHYNRRASQLKAVHPLGIQVHLDTGVANGVLVTRTPAQCAELVRRIMMQTLELELELLEKEGLLVLRERISGCIYRVMTLDPMLTNSFWNFYPTPA